MRITPIYSKSAYISNNRQNNTSKNNVNTGINFKGISVSLILLAAREGVSMIRNNQKNQYIRSLSENLRDLAYCNDETIQAIYTAIAKTPDSFYTKKDLRSSFVELFNNSMYTTPSVADLRGEALERLHCVDDNNSYAIVAKKDFIKSIFDNGHEITREFYNQFCLLSDSKYKNLKEEIIDSCFYSRKYNSSRHYAGYSYPLASYIDSSYGGLYGPSTRIFDGSNRSRENIFNEKLYNNLVLLSSLDKQEYATYIKKNRNIIEQAKQRLENFLCNVNNSALVHYYNNYIKLI